MHKITHAAPSRRLASSIVASACRIELLENRRLMCVDDLAALPADVQAMFDDSGHITATEFGGLPADLQAQVDPHQIEDDRPLAEQHKELDFSVPDVTDAQARAGGTGDAAYALPDLVPLLPGNGGNFLSPYLDQTEQPGRNLLRFSTAVGNQGTGPAILFSGNTPEYQLPDGRQLVKQQLFNYSGGAAGTFTQAATRDAGQFVYHPTHGHFHLEDYATYRLLTSVNGQPGTQVLRADGTEAIGDKVGFCLINFTFNWTTTSGTSNTSVPGYNRPGQPSTNCGFLQGLHAGKADIYDAQYDGQWIDVTGVPNGQYFLEVTLDASDAILETDDVNNTVRVPVTLNAGTPTGGIPLDRFDLLANGGPNNTLATATDLGELGVATQAGLTMHADSDADYFEFTAASSGTYNVELSVANRLVDLYLYDEAFIELDNDTAPPTTTATPSNPDLRRVTASFVEGRTYYVRAEGFSGSGTGGDTGGLSTNYALRVFVNPTVRATAPVADAAEDALAEGAFRIARNGPFSSALTVNFALGGTAVRGVDYDVVYNGAVVTADSIVIGVESLEETLRIVPRADALVEALETVTLTLATNAAYVIGAGANAATVLLADLKPRSVASAFSPLANTVSFDFSLDVSASLAAGDLVLADAATGLPVDVAVTRVIWSSGVNRATFSLAGPLPAGRYVATLAAAGVTHPLGAPLFADATIGFDYLPADLNLSGTVDFADLVALAQNYGATRAVFADGDADYDGDVDFADLVLLAQNYGATTPAMASATGAAPLSESTLARSARPAAFPSTAAATGTASTTRKTDRRAAPQVLA